ncbi:MAG: lysophospholipase [Candidatus Thorarchaeota archaeon]|nr:MAG: lysophospholipase [Candidatus Thorarchaeota archaeon]
MIFKEGTYTGYDGTRMFMAKWIPQSEDPRALLIAVHGLGSHGGDMRTIGEFLAERGIAVFAPDMRGFGHYSGTKGHVMKYEEYIEDMQNIVMEVKDEFKNKLTFLHGSSLGGLHVIWYALTYPRVTDGIVLSCPAVAQSVEVGWGKLFIAKILSLLNVKRYYTGYVPVEDATRNPDVVERHKKDPLRFEGVTPRFGVEVLKAVNRALKMGPSILVPILYQQAGADKLVSPEKSKQFFDSIEFKDKAWILYDGLYHELHEEPESDRVLTDLYSWLDHRMPT